jgi:hypothetical protein
VTQSSDPPEVRWALGHWYAETYKGDSGALGVEAAASEAKDAAEKIGWNWRAALVDRHKQVVDPTPGRAVALNLDLICSTEPNVAALRPQLQALQNDVKDPITVAPSLDQCLASVHWPAVAKRKDGMTKFRQWLTRNSRSTIPDPEGLRRDALKTDLTAAL